MSTLFLFGAGASYGSGECHPHNPPLGKELFRALQRPGSVASSVTPDLAALFEDHFETGMDEFLRTRSTDVVPFMREIGNYLWGFRPGAANLYRAVAGLAAERSNVVLASLNYDLLLDLAVSETGSGVMYDPTLQASGVRVLKVHGSCNFLPDVPPGTFNNVRVGGNWIQSAFRMDVRPVFDGWQIEQFYRTENSLAPAIAMYSPDKRFPVSGDFVDRQQQQWRDEVGRASRIFVIGVAVNRADRHIWGVLASVNGWLSYVGRPSDESVFAEWCAEVGRKDASFLAPGFEEAMPLIRRLLSR